MIRLEEWVDIVALHRQGHGIKTIARHLGISRNAVRRALRRGGPPVYERAQRPSKLDPFKDYLLPEAVIMFRQGIGRLIRTATDEGRVTVLDPKALAQLARAT